MTPAANAPVSLPPIDPTAELSSEIIRALTEYFFSGDLLGGSRIPSERQLAESLGVSRGAVREAIQSLGLLGVLEIRQGAGTYLRSTGSTLLPRVIEWGLFLGERRVMDLVEARQEIEFALAGLAARRRTEEQAAELVALVEQMDDLGPGEAFVAADIAFHSAIARAARNLALADVLSNITSLLEVWMTRSIQSAGETHSSNQEHRRVVEAIVARDPRKAQAAMRAHLRSAEKRLRRTLGDLPEGIENVTT
ncbi:GntR family transcriptional repressor for pyruvate dehydrogenase complex [Microbacterium keratanolyticum]|uniref:Transcriptional regulator n=1 Tax=Microbacterium keratanolyticum TaxID=67574 RepID=A0A9W6HQX7_9MICO|nr:FadR/GntR family transcriptional regulator [Microbacterium keratanolyticum]MBM7468676.1 GntR family transcriptional repressor for pyruvate dehydrogenase complex [Microbacterium keratanolyticum]GLK00752.1 transcriptional regulator [Microbacterium keratanolyticum]